MKIKIETLSNAPGKTFTYDFTVAGGSTQLERGGYASYCPWKFK